METKAIGTSAGTLRLVPPTTEQLRGIARYWPMGLVASSDGSERFGLVFQRGELEVRGLKMQPVDTAEADAKVFHHVNRALIASALPQYLAKQHRGVMVPCAYYRAKATGKAESGIAFFVGPDAASRPGSGKLDDHPFDDELGPGASRMIFDMPGAIAAASKKGRLPLQTTIGMDVRPRSALGGLALYFVVEGPRVFVVKVPLDDDEPVWEYVVRAGFSELTYAPMEPAALPGGPGAEFPRT